MNISMCQLCKDPIWSFICPNCLAREITRWLPQRHREAFSEFNEDFFNSFSATIDVDGLTCLRCRKVRLANMCPFCYFMEAYDWLRERNTTLADNLFRMMPHKGSVNVEPSGVSWKREAMPVLRTHEHELDEGVCEACERYAETIIHYDGRWLCRDCEALER